MSDLLFQTSRSSSYESSSMDSTSASSKFLWNIRTSRTQCLLAEASLFLHCVNYHGHFISSRQENDPKPSKGRIICLLISKGAELASATVPWHWLFFCLASKLCYKNLPQDIPISLEASKWHWLILASIGALDYT